MATAKLTSGSSSISGSMGGTIFRRSQGGQVLQGPPRRITNQHPTRLQRQKAFTQAKNFCKNIVAAGNVQAWQLYAWHHPVKHRSGKVTTWSWRLWAVKFNTIRFFNNVSPILEPPEI